MLLKLAISVLVAVADAGKSSGCGQGLPGGMKKGGTGDSNALSITSNGMKRDYLLHIPEGYKSDTAHGLILTFHGRSETNTHV
jgi:poly(3-hydroxybutyrate) depolymerase